jgi:hypothetical protein
VGAEISSERTPNSWIEDFWLDLILKKDQSSLFPTYVISVLER